MSGEKRAKREGEGGGWRKGGGFEIFGLVILLTVKFLSIARI